MSLPAHYPNAMRADDTPTLPALIAAFGRIGLLSFGGPAAQISLMHQEVVDKRGWLTEQQFLGALSFCMLLPGPEAMQLATYCGWLKRGTLGGLIAGGLFVLPGAAVIATLAALYVAYGDLPLVRGAFLGVQAAVVVIVIAALRGLMRKALIGPPAYLIAALGFLAIFALGLPFPLIVLASALAGAFVLQGADGDRPQVRAVPVRLQDTLRTVLIWGALWAAPLALLILLDTPLTGFLLQLGLFFSKLAIVTFGGAYAVLAYMTQEVVQSYGWIDTQTMIDALGLAETTPGPLILVTQFVGHLAGHASAGWQGLALGGALTLWVTFTPCFLWIFSGAPYIERLLAAPRLRAALSGVSAAVVGVIANLSLWFALHVLFPDGLGDVQDAGTLLSALDLAALALTAFAALLTFGLRLGLLTTLGLTTLTALAWQTLASGGVF